MASPENQAESSTHLDANHHLNSHTNSHSGGQVEGRIENQTENQTWNPDQYARNARFVAELGAPVLEWLAPQSGETILDLGCGDGHLTARLASMGCHVIGVDSSAPQVEASCKLGLDARVMRAQDLDGHADFLHRFDAVFSNATLHWVHPPQRAAEAVYKVLKPGGRYVGEFGGHGCLSSLCEALVSLLAKRGLSFDALNPWYFPTAEAYTALLEEAGFQVDRCLVFPRPTPLPHTVREWLQTFGLCFLAALPGTERETFLDEVTATLKPKWCDAQGMWTADYTRIRFAARRLG